MSTEYDHGVVYHPSVTSSKVLLTVDKFEFYKISYVRVQWVDYTCTVRCKVLSVPYFLAVLKSSRSGVGITKVCLGMADDISALGEWLYIPDLSTLRICPYYPTHAAIMGWFQEKTPNITADNKLSFEVPVCPRGLLRRVVQEAAVLGAKFLVGFESEFIILKSTTPTVEAVDEHSWSDTKGISSGSIQAKVLEEIADGIQASGIELQVYHVEAAPGQFEIVTGPLPPLEAVDALIHTREIIRHTCAKYDLQASFAPKIWEKFSGSSCHTHISVHSDNNVKVPEKLSPLETSFLAPILANLPALQALTTPIPASYKRMVDNIWSGGTYVNWGFENRESPVRVSNATSPSSRNFELRFIDGTANPYLALASILGLGTAGIRDKTELTMKDCPGEAAKMTEEERQSYGITQRMSLSWEQSRKNLRENKLLNEILPKEVTDKYDSVIKYLAKDLGQDGPDSEAAKQKRLVDYY